MDQVKFFEGCLPQILLGPFLNILTHLRLDKEERGATRIFSGKGKFLGITAIR